VSQTRSVVPLLRRQAHCILHYETHGGIAGLYLVLKPLSTETAAVGHADAPSTAVAATHAHCSCMLSPRPPHMLCPAAAAAAAVAHVVRVFSCKLQCACTCTCTCMFMLLLQYDITKERIIALIDADRSMLEPLAEGVSDRGLSHSHSHSHSHSFPHPHTATLTLATQHI